MIIKNLQLSFDHEDGDKLIFNSEAGAEISLSSYLLDDFKDRGSKVYLSLDLEPLLSASENKKDTLNELLGNSEETDDELK